VISVVFGEALAMGDGGEGRYRQLLGVRFDYIEDDGARSRE
jgi:hypothetical protein